SSLNIRDSDAWSMIWDAKVFFEGRMGTTNPLVIDEMRRQLKAFLRIVKRRLNLITDKEELNMLLMEIVAFYDTNKIKRYYPQYSQGQYINKLREDLADYLYQYYTKNGDWIAAIESFQVKDSIPIMTIHKSKGL